MVKIGLKFSDKTKWKRRTARKVSIFVFFWSLFSRIRPEYGVNSVRMRENTDQKNSEYGHFSRSVGQTHK